jgi:DNA-binding transcriptional MocR family regulator
MLQVGLRPIASDEHGPLPDSIDEAARDGRARALFLVPCMHNPTTITMPEDRRRQIADVAQRCQLQVIEDDVYRPLMSDPPPRMADLNPENTFLITGTSKCLAPGLRLGFVVPPVRFVEVVAAALRTNCWVVSPIIALLATRWLEDGTAFAVLNAQREELRARQKLVASALSGHKFASSETCTHAWLFMPKVWRAAEFARAAMGNGVAVLPAEAFALGHSDAPHAVRVNVGAARSQEQLGRALSILVQLLEEGPGPYPSHV